VTDILVHDLELSEVEVDECWSFVGKKGTQTPTGPANPAGSGLQGEEQGAHWGCLTQDRPSRFVVAWVDGPRDETLTQDAVATTRQRTKDHVGIGYVTTGWTPYAEVINTIYREREPSSVNPCWFVLKPTPNGRLTQAIKHRKGRRLVQVKARAVIGAPPELPTPSISNASMALCAIIARA
jgi:hypothetical protein